MNEYKIMLNEIWRKVGPETLTIMEEEGYSPSLTQQEVIDLVISSLNVANNKYLATSFLKKSYDEQQRIAKEVFSLYIYGW